MTDELPPAPWSVCPACRDWVDPAHRCQHVRAPSTHEQLVEEIHRLGLEVERLSLDLKQARGLDEPAG
mgnify:CR=1 FL=1